MRVIERQASREDEHFTEGEPDLEAPEELAVLEVDEEALLEEDLDNRVDLEDEVDEDTLESSLDHLVYDGLVDDGLVDDGDDAGAEDGSDDTDTSDPPAVDVLDDLEVEDLEDIEESLDRIMREKLAGDEDPDGDPDEPVVGAVAGDVDGKVPSCGPDEFVCRSCFLVRSTTQATGPSTSLCHDCSG
ncbi:MAG TPA: hypothetical protein VN791_04115 [Acidimicrobiales bacterium]|nr:hypothetical protein [Acidimicrobiales bacterium]